MVSCAAQLVHLAFSSSRLDTVHWTGLVRGISLWLENLDKYFVYFPAASGRQTPALQRGSPTPFSSQNALSLSSEILKSLYLNSAESRAALSSSTPSVCCNTHTINHRVYDYRHDAYSNRLASALKGKRALLVAL